MSLRVLVIISVGFLLSSCSLIQNSIVSNSPQKSNSLNHQSEYKALSSDLKIESKVSFVSELDSKKVIAEPSERDLRNHILLEQTNSIVEEAESFIGTRYRYGGTTRRGIDCSSFVQKSYKAGQIELPRTAVLQSKFGERISRAELKVGDLVFFATRGRGRVSHVGIVHSVNAENNQIKFIHASSSQGVTITSLSNVYWSPRYLFAKRLLGDEQFKTEDLITDINNSSEQDSVSITSVSL